MTERGQLYGGRTARLHGAGAKGVPRLPSTARPPPLSRRRCQCHPCHGRSRCPVTTSRPTGGAPARLRTLDAEDQRESSFDEISTVAPGSPIGTSEAHGGTHTDQPRRQGRRPRCATRRSSSLYRTGHAELPIPRDRLGAALRLPLRTQSQPRRRRRRVAHRLHQSHADALWTETRSNCHAGARFDSCPATFKNCDHDSSPCRLVCREGDSPSPWPKAEPTTGARDRCGS